MPIERSTHNVVVPRVYAVCWRGVTTKQVSRAGSGARSDASETTVRTKSVSKRHQPLKVCVLE